MYSRKTRDCSMGDPDEGYPFFLALFPETMGIQSCCPGAKLPGKNERVDEE